MTDLVIELNNFRIPRPEKSKMFILTLDSGIIKTELSPASGTPLSPAWPLACDSSHYERVTLQKAYSMNSIRQE
jgi:hypothetical protein